ncbi:MAG: transposase, partial [Clostridia bacterium]|nr:transposase [Clostridia bacterium]
AKRIGCWAHARRKWIDCLPKGIKADGSKAVQALSIVEEIFTVEKGFDGMETEDIYTERIAKIKPLLNKYWELLEKIDAPKGSALDKAVNYSMNNKKELEGFLEDGRLELTNNRAERAVKPFVIARKNFLFSDTSKGAEASALCFTMIECAKLNKLDVFGYLIYLLSELPKLGEKPRKQQLIRMLPWSEDLPEYCKIPKRV